MSLNKHHPSTRPLAAVLATLALLATHSCSEKRPGSGIVGRRLPSNMQNVNSGAGLSQLHSMYKMNGEQNEQN